MLKHIDWIWAVLAGALLAVMVTINSGLAALTTPFTASWVVHGVGGVVAFSCWSPTVPSRAGRGAFRPMARRPSGPILAVRRVPLRWP